MLAEFFFSLGVKVLVVQFISGELCENHILDSGMGIALTVSAHSELGRASLLGRYRACLAAGAGRHPNRQKY
jgi:hypothetical protein